MHGGIAEIVPRQDGCAFVLGDDGPPGVVCNAPRRPGSPYCAEHHDLCRLPGGSDAEDRQLREIEALALTVGGRLGRDVRAPPEPLLRRLARAERVFSHSKCSRIVQSKEAMMAARANGKNGAATAASDNEATPERLQHGPVERLPQAVPDAAGRLVRPYRAVDTLVIMERRGSITASMRQAGEDFRARFTIAQLDPLRALDLRHFRFGDAQTRPEREAPGLRIEAARRTVWRAIQAVGGIASPAGSCLWHVLGWQQSLKEWGLEQGWSGRQVSQEAASGIFVAALGALESHFATSRQLSSPHFSLDKSGSM